MLLLGGHYPTIGVVNARKWHSLKGSTGGSQGPGLQLTLIHRQALWALVHCGEGRSCQRHKMLLFCRRVAFSLPLQGRRARENTCDCERECFCAMWGVREGGRKKKGIITSFCELEEWERGGVIEAPLADGCTCNPAVMRQHQNHTPHT